MIELRSLTGIGPSIQTKLGALGIYSIEDLLLHFPRKYIDKTKIHQIYNLIPEQETLIEGNIIAVTNQKTAKPKLYVELSDATGTIKLTWFKFYQQQLKHLVVGNKIRCFGKVQQYGLELYMTHPEYQLLSSKNEILLDTTLTPVYPVVSGISQKFIRNTIKQAIELCSANNNIELLPKEVMAEFSGLSFIATIKKIHLPDPDTATTEILAANSILRKRLAFEELLAHHLSHRTARNIVVAKQSYILPTLPDIEIQIKAMLPFELTNAQTRVISEIFSDMACSKPMMRLVQGDVGSGKTIVAILASIMAVKNGKQVVVMAPTEILAEQHYFTFNKICSVLSIKVGLYTGSLSNKNQYSMREKIAMGMLDIVIGTHALFQDGVACHNLALVIIDEQHRFGVTQRESLWYKGNSNDEMPHLLVMTATPIPRSLALIFYADLDCSVIDELPAVRRPIKTVALSQQKREEVIDRVKNICAMGQQVYWVCPFIEESEVLSGQAVSVVVNELQSKLAPFKVTLLHGKIDANTKQQIMSQFLKGEIQVLCATTVIEVGIDVPNATLMVIENSERLGLSQLHQLRGRVGRGAENSYCVLMYGSPLTEKAKNRLSVIRNISDGFKIAEEDLRLRGPGDLFGTKQTGSPTFRIADLSNDIDLLPKISKMADNFINQSQPLVSRLIKRWVVTTRSSEVI
jgi:ATP-dependent DNA helicase RecG